MRRERRAQRLPCVRDPACPARCVPIGRILPAAEIKIFGPPSQFPSKGTAERGGSLHVPVAAVESAAAPAKRKAPRHAGLDVAAPYPRWICVGDPTRIRKI